MKNTHFVDDKMLRRTNYTNRLPQNQHNHYGSIYKTDFPKHPHGMATLNEEKKADLRKHHFEFGFDHLGSNQAPQNQSEFQREFVKKEVPQGVRDEANATKDRARSSVSLEILIQIQATIWADPNNYFKSMYDEDYPAKSINNQDAREEAKKALVQLRSSNILIGNSRPDYETLHNETYVRFNSNFKIGETSN